MRREPTGALALEVLRGGAVGRVPSRPRPYYLDREKRLVALDVAQRAGLLLAVLLGALGGLARVGQLGLERLAVDLLRRDRLLDEHQRAVLGELQVALGLREAHDLTPRSDTAAARSAPERASSGSWLARMPIEPTVVNVESISISSLNTSPSGVSTSAGNFAWAIISWPPRRPRRSCPSGRTRSRGPRRACRR